MEKYAKTGLSSNDYLFRARISRGEKLRRATALRTVLVRDDASG
jgi:hypothetical protein